jgi:hypothetical protein
MSIHHNPGCSRIRPRKKSGQRICKLDPTTISAELQKFRNREHRFASTPHLNDMWLEIDFQDGVFEMAVLKHIRKLLGQHYKPFANSSLEMHC